MNACQASRLVRRAREAREGGPWLAFRDDQLTTYWYHLHDKVVTYDNPYFRASEASVPLKSQNRCRKCLPPCPSMAWLHCSLQPFSWHVVRHCDLLMNSKAVHAAFNLHRLHAWFPVYASSLRHSMSALEDKRHADWHFPGRLRWVLA